MCLWRWHVEVQRRFGESLRRGDGSQLIDVVGRWVGPQNPFRGLRGKLRAAMLAVVEQALGEKSREHAEEIREGRWSSETVVRFEEIRYLIVVRGYCHESHYIHISQKPIAKVQVIHVGYWHY